MVQGAIFEYMRGRKRYQAALVLARRTSQLNKRLRGGRGCCIYRLRRAPEVNHRNLVHARNCTSRSAALLGQELALPLLIGIILKRNARVPALLRAVMN